MPDLNRIQASEPVLITDGTDTVSILSSTPSGTEPGLVVREAGKGQQATASSTSVVLASDHGVLPIDFPDTFTYAVSTTNNAVSATNNSTSSLAYLWHPSAVTKTYKIWRIVVSTNNLGSTSQLMFKVARITAEAGTPGGTSLTPVALNGGSASGSVFRFQATGAPTRVSPEVLTRLAVGSAFSTSVMDFPNNISPLTCRAGVAEGWEVRLEVMTTALSNLRISVEFLWTEE